MRFLSLVITIILVVSCKNNNNTTNTDKLIIIKGDTTFYDSLQKRWYYKEYKKDSVCGIALKKAYKSIVKGRDGKEVIVALIDQDVNTEHEDLKDFIWINKKEIVGNGKDDDNNGYVDDINGWNFLRNDKGFRLLYTTNSNINFVNKYRNIFEKDSTKNPKLYSLYKKALKDISENKDKHKQYLNDANDYEKNLISSRKSIDSLFQGYKPSTEELDSVYYKYEVSNPSLANKADFIYNHIVFDWSDYVRLTKKDAEGVKEITNNINWNLNDESNGKLGSPKINGDLTNLTHGTLVAGPITANQTNNLGTEGVTNNVKLMILSLQARKGAENDELIAKAIKYAVDNGANLINYSASKSFSANEILVKDALEYANKNNVLFITSAGNGGINLNESEMHPNGKIDGKDLSNFITVGASYAYPGEYLKPEFSNYGNNYVDLFAPGAQIYTTTSKGKYKLEGGTSLSASLVSGVAAMLYSYYPNLTASQIKNILVSTVDEYDIEVKISEGVKLNFKDLSKSGGILNAYKALKKAEEISSKLE